MLRVGRVFALLAGLAAGSFALGGTPAPELTIAQVVAKNVSARGGLAAWRNVQTMVWFGHLQSANAPNSSVVFILEQKRPNKTRFEINSAGQRSVRVYDGVRGWKTRGGRGGESQALPYSAQELKFAHEAQAIDGPLMDVEAKGSSVELRGMERIEGRETYRLAVRSAAGEEQTVWLDAQTFLELRLDRVSYSAAGQPVMVSVFYRNYETIEGLTMPSTLEIEGAAGKNSDRMVIDRIALNTPLDDGLFGKPGAQRGGGMGDRAGGAPRSVASDREAPAGVSQ